MNPSHGELQIWIDGQLVPKHQAKISVYDHGLLYGDGVFEGIRQYNGRIFEKDAHLNRLYESAAAIRLTIPYSRPELADAMEQTIHANNFSDCYLRLVVTRGIGYLGISPKNCERPSVFCIADKIQMYPETMYAHGMPIITASTIRNHPNSLSPKIKSLNYLNNIMAKWEAHDAGVSEAVMLNHLGYVCECTGDNIFMVKNGIVSTPPEDSGILVGITRQVVIGLLHAANIPLQERNLTRYDLYTADELFLTGTGAEVIPVNQIDNRPIANNVVGPITKLTMAAFHKKVRAG